MSNDNNIIHVCPDCIDQRTKDFQANFDDNMAEFMTLVKRQGRGFVKTGFVIEKGKPDREHMWVQVASLSDIDFDAKTITGTLNNDPIYVKHIKLNDPVVIPFDAISDIIG